MKKISQARNISLLVIFLAFLFATFFPGIVKAETDVLPNPWFRMVSTQPLVDLLQSQFGLPKNVLGVPLVDSKICGKVLVEWDRVELANEYELYRNGRLIYKGSERSFLDENLIYLARYSYSVRALNKEGSGEISKPSNLIADILCPPEPPKHVSVRDSNKCGGHIELRWADVYGATHYKVERSAMASAGGSLIPHLTGKNRLQWRPGLFNRFSGKSVRFQGSNTAIIDSGSPDSDYTYRIYSWNNGGWSQDAVEVSGRTSAECLPEAPSAPRSR